MDPSAPLERPVSLTRLPDGRVTISGRIEAGATEQATVLADRLPGQALFELFRQQDGGEDRFEFGREADGSPAGP